MAAPTGSVQLTEVLVKYSLPLMVNKRCLKLLSDIDTRAEPDKLTPTFDLSFPYILQGSTILMQFWPRHLSVSIVMNCSSLSEIYNKS